VQKVYHAQDADEFLPFSVFLTLHTAGVFGQGLTRTMTLLRDTQSVIIVSERGQKAESKVAPAMRILIALTTIVLMVQVSRFTVERLAPRARGACGIR